MENVEYLELKFKLIAKKLANFRYYLSKKLSHLNPVLGYS